MPDRALAGRPGGWLHSAYIRHHLAEVREWDTAGWVKDAERKVELDALLPEVLAGKRRPADAAETLEYALVCYYKGRFADAARLSAEAFADDANLVAKPQADNRYLAARAAVKAGDRKQSLEWLRADLALWQEQGKSDKYADRLRVRCKLNHWRTHDDLLAVREAKTLAALPDDERHQWQRLWADVAELLDGLRPPEPADR